MSERLISPAAMALYERIAGGGQPSPEDTSEVSELLNLQLLRSGSGEHCYTAVDPSYVGARLAATFHEEAARQLMRAAEVNAALEVLRPAYAARPVSDQDGTVEYLSGHAVINARLGQVLAGCTESLFASQPDGPRRPEALATVRQRDLAALNRGVAMRTLYSDDARAGAGMHEWVAEMTSAGAEIRTTEESFPRMIIVDGRVAVIPGDDDSVARIIHDPGVARFLADHLFGSYWARAMPWAGEENPALALTNARYERILLLMASGRSQREIGKQLNLGARRLAEIVAELKVIYGAESLFQLACRWREDPGRASSHAGE